MGHHKSITEPKWKTQRRNQFGSFSDYHGSLAGPTWTNLELFGSLADLSRIVARLKLGPNLEVGPFGTLLVPLGSILEP